MNACIGRFLTTATDLKELRRHVKAALERCSVTSYGSGDRRQFRVRGQSGHPGLALLAMLAWPFAQAGVGSRVAIQVDSWSDGVGTAHLTLRAFPVDEWTDGEEIFLASQSPFEFIGDDLQTQRIFTRVLGELVREGVTLRVA